MMTKAVFFDMDDTLIAFDGVQEPTWRSCIAEAIHERALPVDADRLYQKIDEIASWYWSDPDRHREGRMDIRTARRRFVSSAFEALAIGDESAAHDLADTYSTRRLEAILLFPRVRETLKALRDKGLYLAMITNGTSEEQRYKINRFGLAGYFDQIYIEQEVGYGKPDPRVYRDALRAAGVRPEEAWMIGDHLIWDILSPKNLGLHTIWFDWRGEGLPTDSHVSPDFAVRQIHEIIPILEAASISSSGSPRFDPA